MKLKLLATLLLLTTATAYCQDDAVKWINKNAFELDSGSSKSNDDLSFLSKELRGKTIVGLGEASHGTREFYVQKARMIEHLVSKCDFRQLAFEFAQTHIAPINQYLQTGEGNLKELMRPMALYNTEEIYNLFQWIRQYNQGQSPENKVVLTGADREVYWSDPFTRDKYMAENIIKSYEIEKRKTIVWAHNVHIAKDTTMAEVPAMGTYLKRHFGAKFYVVGFDTYKGTVNVLSKGEFETHPFEGNENSFSGTFAKARYETFFLPFNRERTSFTETTGLITNIYSNWQKLTPLPIRPGVDFDAIVFIRNTSASVKLE